MKYFKVKRHHDYNLLSNNLVRQINRWIDTQLKDDVRKGDRETKRWRKRKTENKNNNANRLK